jgi:hypothetical protein
LEGIDEVEQYESQQEYENVEYLEEEVSKYFNSSFYDEQIILSV